MPKPLLTVGELIDQSWDVFRSRMSELLTISGWMLITAILFSLALIFYPSASTVLSTDTLSFWENLGVIVFAVTKFIIAPIMSFWILIALTRAVQDILSKKAVNTGVIVREARHAFFPALLTSFMVILMVILAIIIGLAVPALLATLASLTNSGFLIIIANLLLIVGIFIALMLSIKWVVYYFMALYLTILDNLPAKQALATSRQLIEGRFWAVLARLAVPKIVFLVFGAFAMAVVAYLVGILIEASAGFSFDIQLRISTLTQTVVPILIAIVINPIIVISDVLLLRSLKS